MAWSATRCHDTYGKGKFVDFHSKNGNRIRMCYWAHLELEGKIRDEEATPSSWSPWSICNAWDLRVKDSRLRPTGHNWAVPIHITIFFGLRRLAHIKCMRKEVEKVIWKSDGDICCYSKEPKNSDRLVNQHDIILLVIRKNLNFIKKPPKSYWKYTKI